MGHANHLHQLLEHSAWARADGAAQLSRPGVADCFDRTSAAIGGGHYPRLRGDAPGGRLYLVRKLCAVGEYATVTQALAQWKADKAATAGLCGAVIEIADSGTYHEAPCFRLEPGEYLQLRAASMARPVLRMFDYGGARREAIVIHGGPASRFVLDGVKVAGGALTVSADADGPAFEVALRHCTLVPNWDTESAGAAPWRGKPSVTLCEGRVALQVDHCIVGVLCHARAAAPCTLTVSDSIVDAGHAAGLALADDAYGAAAMRAVFSRATVVGAVQIDQIEMAENTIFLGALMVGRRHSGQLRFCYVAPGSRTPPRTRCQPDLAQHGHGPCHAFETQRVQPVYRSLRYGNEEYCKLSRSCADEIAAGANDAAEMGAWHDLHRSALHMAHPGTR